MYDLGYSVEVLEHIDEKYINNYMPIFENCKYVVIMAAPPGWPGVHHVNCKDHDYWIDVFSKHGLIHYPYGTKLVRESSTMNNKRPYHKRFIAHRALFFVNFINIQDMNIKRVIKNNDMEKNTLYFTNEKSFYVDPTKKAVRNDAGVYEYRIPLYSGLGNPKPAPAQEPVSEPEPVMEPTVEQIENRLPVQEIIQETVNDTEPELVLELVKELEKELVQKSNLDTTETAVE